MTATVRLPLLLAAVALSAFVLPVPLVAALFVAVFVAWFVDARAARTMPRVGRTLPHILSRGRTAPISISVESTDCRIVRVRQARVPDVEIEPASAPIQLVATIRSTRRGRHVLPPVAVRTEGPLRIGAWNHNATTEAAELLVYPDLVAAQNLASAVRRDWFRDAGRRTRGRLALGTEFESIRDYLPDDDIRQVNWKATARTGRPMSNQYRIDQDRDVLCVVDTGRLMSAPLGDRTRLDIALDAAVAVALVADELGDRCGALAFDAQTLRVVRPRRAGGDAVTAALFDLEPRPVDSDYELAFRTLGGMKRAYVLLFTDLLDEAAARSLQRALPLLARRHAVAVATAADTELLDKVRVPPQRPAQVYETAVALDVLDARTRVTALLRASGVDVIEAPPDRLGAECVAAYLRAKSRARL